MHDHNARPSSSHNAADPNAEIAADGSEAPHGHSMWWMVACCAPMVLIALALLLGVFGTR